MKNEVKVAVMKAYMGYAGDPHDGAILIFAHNAKQAKRLAYPEMSNLFDCMFCDARVKWLKGEDYLFENADKEKLAAGIAHIVDNPISCKSCEMWGSGELDADGVCASCRDTEEMNAVL